MTQTANQVWLDLLGAILSFGDKSAPRGMVIKELLGFKSTIDMTRPLVTLPERELGYKFAAAEPAWILSGDNRVETIAPFSKAIVKYSDDGETFAGAYGPRILPQLPYVLQTLRSDPDSRQAVINIWRDSPSPSKDIACSLSVQFLIRNGKLNCIYTMRSSDAWLGWVYDVVNFSLLSTHVLIDLRPTYPDLKLGDLHLVAGSQHLYERDWKSAYRVMFSQAPPKEYPPIDPNRWATSQALVDDLWRAAKDAGLLEFLRS